MIIKIKLDKEIYAIVEYDEKSKIFKIKEESPQSIIDQLNNRLSKEFWIWDPRDGLSYETKNPKDSVQAYLCLEQALQGTKAKIIYEELDVMLPEDKPGLVH